ncbi:MAG: type I-C CRISPR-associated protein Cas8c/Csd1 [Bacteroidales bacterium]
MSWLEELYYTYENCSGKNDLITPPFHMLQNTHIEIIISKEGEFKDANREELKNTIIPCSEKSEAARTNNPPPHPLCDKIQFVAKDYRGPKKSYFDKYINLLSQWANYENSHPMVRAIYKYVSKGHVISDLIKSGKKIIHENEDPGNLFVRWNVEITGEYETRCWKCKSLHDNWQEFYCKMDSVLGTCMVTGKYGPLALNHPKRIRHSADGGKLISSNDKSGFTFRGRFLTDQITKDGKNEVVAIQSASVSEEVSQKAHRVLNWLIQRQSFRNGDQIIVSWAVTGKNTPDVLADSFTLFGESDKEKINDITKFNYTDAGQTFARKLSKKIAGYRAELTPADKIVVMVLDSAGPGRIAITYYRELTGSDFLDRIEDWHLQMAWHFNEFLQDPDNHKKRYHGNLVMAPAPSLIAEACYGRNIDEKLKKSTIERILPCIIDSRQLPIDLVNKAVKRASNRIGLQHWEWERTLSIACALFSCYIIRNEKNTNINTKIMALELDRNDRDYLYGRLLAVAEHIEEIALNLVKEPRETTAARLMQRFADFPFSTWRSIESALVPYKARLHVNRPGFLYNMLHLLDEIHGKFKSGDYENDSRLSGAYLLGYHCQRLNLKEKKSEEKS